MILPLAPFRHRRPRSRFLLTAILLLVAAPAASQTAEQVESILNRIEWRNVGPAIMGGRIDDIAVVESDPKVFWVGTASAGVWKTENHGITWIPQFQNEEVSSIGSIAVSASDPSVVWVGTGEPANRQSSSWGNGVYLSTDGGTTWTHKGLEDTHHIGRVLVHPTDPGTVYVAALGHLWGPNDERGVYRTRDGGETWDRVLHGDENTGAVELAMDPDSPDIVYAALYQRRRRAYGFAGGGPGSGIHRTTDGGDTWMKLGGGLPEGDTGRIGLSVYRRDPRIVYAIVENREGGVFRSEDKGLNWERMSDTNPRPMYYSQIRIDPNNDQRIWVLGTQMYYSQDGGRTFATDWVQRIHVDHHALWIDPADSNHMVLGNDGGIHISWDRGRSWDFVNTIPLGQFYEIGHDMGTPYMVYGGLQDNGSWGAPSRTFFRQGISNEDWFRIGGGDGFYTEAIPGDPDTVYVESQNGNLRRLNRRTSETKLIRPQPENGGERYRFDWNSPIVISPHDPDTVLYGGNRLFISENRGDAWTRTDDLTKRLDRDELPIMGVPVTDDPLSRHDGISSFGQIVTIAVSSVEEGVIYVGADDGSLQRSRDGGETWDNLTGNLPGVPDQTYVTRLIASAHSASRVYVTLDGHRNDDYSTYVFRSDDYGDSFDSIGGTLPPEAALNVIREHHDNEDFLVTGGEFGVYVTLDRGANWHRIGGQIPTVPVDDLAIHPRENDLILGTHGRSVWIADDIAPLTTLDASVFEKDVHLFPVRDAVAWRIYTHKGNTGHKFFIAPNPPEGALLHVYAKAEGDAEITVSAAGGDAVRTLKAELEPGLNRVNWDLRYDSPVPDGGQGFGGPPQGPRVLPGSYTVRVASGDAAAEGSVQVSEDPRIRIPDADRRANHDALVRLTSMVAGMTRAHEAADATAKEAAELVQAFVSEPDTDLKTRVGEFREAAAEAAKNLSRNEGRQGRGAWPRPLFARIGAEARSLDAYTEAPNAEILARIDAMSAEYDERIAAWEAVRGQIDSLNEALRGGGPPRLTPRPSGAD
ncbi:MAG: hypothetical protein OXE58_04345 [Acidobacteria bacterium]|nr:hypothetical protein [Acidobacteriota bacterium]